MNECSNCTHNSDVNSLCQNDFVYFIVLVTLDIL